MNFLQNQFPQILYWSDDRWKACLAAGGGAKRIYQFCTDDSGIIVYLRALQGHSGRNLIDPSLQDNVIILPTYVKSTSPTTENGYENCTYSMNINMSDEDNNNDTNYINKYNDANHDTRKLHL